MNSTTNTVITTNDIRALRDEAASAGDEAMVDICTAALSGNEEALAECERVIEENRLYAELSDGWSVVDPHGGRWWPHDDAAEEIAASADPEAVALAICESQPMRGEWHQ